MPGSFTDHDNTWNATAIAATAIASGAGVGVETAPISLDGSDGALVSVSCSYGATANEGVKVYVLGDTDGTNYETVASGAWGWEHPKTPGSVLPKLYAVSAVEYSAIIIRVENNSGAGVTVTVRYKLFRRTNS